MKDSVALKPKYTTSKCKEIASMFCCFYKADQLQKDIHAAIVNNRRVSADVQRKFNSTSADKGSYEDAMAGIIASRVRSYYEKSEKNKPIHKLEVQAYTWYQSIADGKWKHPNWRPVSIEITQSQGYGLYQSMGLCENPLSKNCDNSDGPQQMKMI